MALANRRPVAFPVSEAGASTSSPSYKPRRLSLNQDFQSNSALTKSLSSSEGEKDGIIRDEIRESTPDKSVTSTPEETFASPTNTNPSSVSSQSTPPPSGTIKEKKEKPPKEKKEKKEKKESSRAPIATGISTTIPVTGERPKPIEGKSLDDSVLYAIFLILFDNDAEGKGMTVKQICDVLIERHPEMSKLSSKTSNLVSAKLNAYVKRVEKGEKELVYALSREWADASPKRMVYVYRGLLTPDYYVHALAAIESQKQASNDTVENQQVADSAGKKSIFEGFNRDDHLVPSVQHEMKRRATAFDLGITRNSFADAMQLDLSLPQLSIPYSAAPVTASLGLNKSSASGFKIPNNHKDHYHPSNSSTAILDYDLESFDNLNEEEDDDEDMDDFIGGSQNFQVKTTMRAGNKRSKSMSFLQSKKSSHPLTIAAAAPRFLRTQITPTSSATAAAIAALHAATLEDLAPAGSVASGSERDSKFASSLNSNSRHNEPYVAPKWLKAVRDGFLTQDISTPEDISLAELDSMLA
ncbi:hypothetical protein WICMUC_000918 [Wickerhamomyces mucosus]|uniref:GDS1 winged helix domain-containing protein n=1 Tax=Wickerhamomyces mucosus TaxID=1378264 RepID=A0A9P8PXU6_9ASCO|nr:hypothetical protein WICMUC_000918 [Wickerhamomyces mucosus]